MGMDLELEWEEPGWQRMMDSLPRGSVIPAERFFAMLGAVDEEGALEAALTLTARGVGLDVSRLPQGGPGAAGERLAREAEDAVQDAFVKYLEKAPAFASGEHERAWLLRVLINGCKSRLRAPWRRRTTPLLDTYPAAAEEERLALEEISALPPKERAVIHLYYYEGYPTAEIAALTGEREGTVRSRLTRARARLRELLKGET